MTQKAKVEALEKLKFYEKNMEYFFWAFMLSIFFITLVLVVPEENSLSTIPLLALIVSGLVVVISLAIITWGMLYHQIKRKAWLWLLLAVVLFFIGIGVWISSLIFYYTVMRKEFKKGNGVYD